MSCAPSTVRAMMPAGIQRRSRPPSIDIFSVTNIGYTAIKRDRCCVSLWMCGEAAPGLQIGGSSKALPTATIRSSLFQGGTPPAAVRADVICTRCASSSNGRATIADMPDRCRRQNTAVCCHISRQVDVLPEKRQCPQATAAAQVQMSILSRCQLTSGCRVVRLKMWSSAPRRCSLPVRQHFTRIQPSLRNNCRSSRSYQFAAIENGFRVSSRSSTSCGRRMRSAA